MKKKFVFIFIIIVIVAAGFWYFSFKQKQDDFLYAGTIEATRVDIPARLATVISHIAVSEGDKVTKDQILFELECDDLKIQNELVTQNYERTQRLVKVGSVPRESYDLAKSKRDETKLKLSWCKGISPLSGTVLTRYRESGEWVSPGMKLLTLADLNSPWAIVYVPQTLVAQLKLGMTVAGFLPELNMKRFDGQITKINSEAEFTPKNVQTREERTRLVYGIKITFANTEEILKPGMSIEVQLPDKK